MNAHRWLAIAALALAARASVAQERLVRVEAQRPVEIVPDLELATFAVAERDSTHSFIRFNPMLIERVGRDIGLYVLVRETARIRLGHLQQTLVVDDSASLGRFRARERAAECLSAQVLAAAAPSALRAAIEWLTDAGDSAGEDGQPNGAERARTLAACSKTLPLWLV